MAEYVIRCLGMADGRFGPFGQYLKSYDPEAFDGRGMADFTESVEEAMKFPDSKAAWDCWTAVPKVRPIRQDGKPNKPLTAFTVEISPVDELEPGLLEVVAEALADREDDENA